MSTTGNELQRLAQALRLMREALEQPDAQRAGWVAQQCGADAALHQQVLRLLEADQETDGLLDRPLMVAFAQGVEDEADPRIGQRIGPFVLRETIGRGGMGQVYRAQREAEDFAQTVALKLLRAGTGEDAIARRRLARERQILVRLQHPNIARFLDGGITNDGQPWYAMELIEGGETLIAHVERTEADLPTRLRLLMQVCDAVQFAHQNLVLHRDLKPANILIDTQGQVRLLDFGIAKLLDADAEPGSGQATGTAFGAFTPDYAAPEQMSGQAVGTPADIYALGVILYELLTGERPFRRGMVAFTTHEFTPEAPSKRLARTDARRAAALRGDLDTIALTCLNLEPVRRYGSVAALKRDLERHLAGLPIEARPDSFGYRTGKFLRRHRLAVAAATLALLALLATTAFSVAQMRRAERESARATAAVVSLQRERDAALEEMGRQETLREHFVVVLDRATRGESISAQALLDLAADPNLLGQFGDAPMQAALQLALSDLFLQRGDYPRVLELLDAMQPNLLTASARTRVLADLNRADAAIRVGKMDELDAALIRIERDMTPEQREGGMVPAHALMLRGQWLRARGDMQGATDAARQAAALAANARDGSPLARGIQVGSASTALLLAGDLPAAIELAEQAQSLWRDANVSINTFANTVASNQANALFLRGDVQQAMALIERIDADPDQSESPPSRAARAITKAKLLALLDRPTQAITTLDAAIDTMCRHVGRDSPDCFSTRLAGVDARHLANRVGEAQAELTALLPRLQGYPPLLATAQRFTLALALRQHPDAQHVDALLGALPAVAQASPMARRNVVRALLVLAQFLHREGHIDEANTLARAAIDTAQGLIDETGMDGSLLRLWRARLAHEPPPQEALQHLETAIGPAHPWLAAHRSP